MEDSFKVKRAYLTQGFIWAMELLYFFLIIVAVYWLYQHFIAKLGRNGVSQTTGSSNSSDQSPDSESYLRQRDAFDRERYELERRAQKWKTHIIDNATEADEDGFVGFDGSWSNEFHIREKGTGKIYKGRVKVNDELMVTVKLSGWSQRRKTKTLDLQREVDEIY